MYVQNRKQRSKHHTWHREHRNVANGSRCKQGEMKQVMRHSQHSHSPLVRSSLNNPMAGTLVYYANDITATRKFCRESEKEHQQTNTSNYMVVHACLQASFTVANLGVSDECNYGRTLGAEELLMRTDVLGNLQSIWGLVLDHTCRYLDVTIPNLHRMTCPHRLAS